MIATRTIRLLSAFLLALGLSVGVSAQRKKQIAVLDFDFATVDIGLAQRAYGTHQNLARRVADKLINTLVALKTCQVVERSQLEKVLREQNLAMDGRIDPNTAAKVGRILGVDALIIGNVSVFEIRGLPKDNRDMLWDPKGMRARIAVNFRIVDTTTGVVELSNEMIGMSPQGPKTSAGERVGRNIFGGLIGNNQGPEVKDEQIRDVVGQAVDEVVGNMTGDVQKYLSGALRPPEPTVTADKLINGRVLSVAGPSLVITNVNKSSVRIGDRLFIRRFKTMRDETTGKDISFSEKVGEVEVVEIQDQAIIGSFAGSGLAQASDTVTNSPTGAGLAPDPIRETRSSSPPAPISPQAQQAKTAQTQQQEATPQNQQTGGLQAQQLQIHANRNWNDTGIDVQPGKQIELVATGLVKISPTREVPPSGLMNRPAPPTLPLPGTNIGALVAKICHLDGQCSPIQLVGARIILSPGKAGRLMLGVNDSEVADNSGYFTVTVR